MKDKVVEELIQQELERQQNTIELIASENIVSQDVMDAMGSVLTNKYAEGKVKTLTELEKDGMYLEENMVWMDKEPKPLGQETPIGKRYYNGCHVIDRIEMLACDRFRELFNTDYHVNVQPHSGAQANMAVFEALLDYGDTVLSMDLSNGGHLSHGSPVNYSGKHFNVIQYGINENGEIDYEEVERLAIKHRPKLIICGASNYSKIINFERFAQIRDKVIDTNNKVVDELEQRGKLLYPDFKDIEREDYIKCYLLADIAHIAGLVAGGAHPSPFGYADVVTTTTHKSLRGPRGGVIACKPELAKKIDSAVFPGIQGGPLEHIIAAKAVCFGEALKPEFKEYAEQIVKNSKALCQTLMDRGFNIVGGMTENHLFTLDLRDKGITGKDAANLLDKYGITVNKNTVPNDPQSPFVTSGLRIGTPAVTTRGFKEDDMVEVGNIIADIILYRNETREGFNEYLNDAAISALDLCKKYPIYKEN